MWCPIHSKAHLLNNVTHEHMAERLHDMNPFTSHLPIPPPYLKTLTTLDYSEEQCSTWTLKCLVPYMPDYHIHLRLAADCLFSLH